MDRGSQVINLFDGPYVTVDGQRLDVPEGGKRLLAYVCLVRGPVERRRVAGALWPDGDDVRAAGNLRSALWRLKGGGSRSWNRTRRHCGSGRGRSSTSTSCARGPTGSSRAIP